MSTDAQRQARRAWIQRHAACPRCGAQLGRPCVGVNGRERVRNHEERLQLAVPGLAARRAKGSGSAAVIEERHGARPGCRCRACYDARRKAAR